MVIVSAPAPPSTQVRREVSAIAPGRGIALDPVVAGFAEDRVLAVLSKPAKLVPARATTWSLPVPAWTMLSACNGVGMQCRRAPARGCGQPGPCAQARLPAHWSVSAATQDVVIAVAARNIDESDCGSGPMLSPIATWIDRCRRRRRRWPLTGLSAAMVRLSLPSPPCGRHAGPAGRRYQRPSSVEACRRRRRRVKTTVMSAAQRSAPPSPNSVGRCRWSPRYHPRFL